MSTDLPQFYTDQRGPESSTYGEKYELVMLARHSVTGQPLYILRSTKGGFSEAVPFDEVGKTWGAV